MILGIGKVAAAAALKFIYGFYCARTSNFHVKKSQYWNAKFGYSHVSTNWLPLLGKTEPSTSFAVLCF